MKYGWILVSLVFVACASPCLASRCDNPTGFMKQLCESQATPLMGLKTGALTTGVGQKGPSDVLPGTIDAKGFEPLSKLERNNSGAFVLSAGMYEVDAEAFTLDSGNPVSLLTAGFWPAPIQGGRAGLLGDLLKNTELHPELRHEDIQELIYGLMAGAELKDMSAQAQQAAVVLLSQQEVAQLGGLPKGQGNGKHTLAMDTGAGREEQARAGSAEQRRKTGAARCAAPRRRRKQDRAEGSRRHTARLSILVDCAGELGKDAGRVLRAVSAGAHGQAEGANRSAFGPDATPGVRPESVHRRLRWDAARPDAAGSAVTGCRGGGSD